MKGVQILGTRLGGTEGFRRWDCEPDPRSTGMRQGISRDAPGLGEKREGTNGARSFQERSIHTLYPILGLIDSVPLQIIVPYKRSCFDDS